MSADMEGQKIAIFLNNKKNEQLLQDYLSDKYEILTAVNLESLEEVDLIIVDGVRLKEYRERIEELKKGEEPVFLPVLLVTTKKDIKLYKNELFRIVDEVITIPIERLELLARLYNLLRVRTLTLILEQESIADPLTGLFNRRYMKEILEKEFMRAKRYNLPLSLLMIDIDFFKKINDTYGHTVGDQVLIEVSRRLLNSLRQIDSASRWGGEEFLVVLPNTGRRGAIAVGERIREEVAKEPVVTDKGDKIWATVSVGVASLEGSTDEYESLKPGDMIELADKALYRAKRSGRNRVLCLQD
ncbi:two-component system cell cycle response regulator [Hydrogenivirga caldilitoris]|uniref:diguanylate cyclase n=2 Tax=Hydrogenivirga caldilitoris TaxID=246264 RepID=A0A497XR00_9AQUI|nr:two-component system cell cycle response regulator [Hydrogenivirga caldilitoris]